MSLIHSLNSIFFLSLKNKSKNQHKAKPTTTTKKPRKSDTNSKLRTDTNKTKNPENSNGPWSSLCVDVWSALSCSWSTLCHSVKDDWFYPAQQLSSENSPSSGGGACAPSGPHAESLSGLNCAGLVPAVPVLCGSALFILEILLSWDYPASLALTVFLLPLPA